jgi:F-type H+-transporting ATPase subunit a
MRGWAIAAVVIVTIVIGFLFLGGPTPVIIVAPETVFHWGGLDVTNTMFTSWIVVAILCLVAVFAGPRMQLVPTGFSGFIEAIVSGFYGIVENVVGEERAREFFWVVATIFFYVIASNYFGLLPLNFTFGLPEAGHGETQVEFRQTSIAGIDIAYIPFNPAEIEVESHAEEGAAGEGAAQESASDDHADDESAAEVASDGSFTGLLAPYLRSVNTDANTPLAIALYSFIFVEFWGLRALGLGYLKKFFNFGNLLRGKPSGLIDVFVGLLEIISELSRIISFTFRLFGNIFAGEVLLVMMGFLAPLVVINVFYGLELFVGAVQAFVFAMLTLVFAQTAVAHHGGDHDDEHAAAHE